VACTPHSIHIRRLNSLPNYIDELRHSVSKKRHHPTLYPVGKVKRGIILLCTGPEGKSKKKEKCTSSYPAIDFFCNGRNRWLLAFRTKSGDVRDASVSSLCHPALSCIVLVRTHSDRFGAGRLQTHGLSPPPLPPPPPSLQPIAVNPANPDDVVRAQDACDNNARTGENVRCGHAGRQ